jgi:transcriptional regulator with XRE-family HTH domain
MAKRKVHPRPGALTEVLKRLNMTQADAAKDAARGTTIIDRKTLARIDRGEEVKLETLEKLAKRLGVPTSYFDSPSDNSVAQAGQPDELTLRTVDAEGLADLLKSNVGGRLQWQLNVHQLDDGAVSVLDSLSAPSTTFVVI